MLPSLKQAKSQKMDGWKTSFVLGWPIFNGYVSFREGNLSSESLDMLSTLGFLVSRMSTVYGCLYRNWMFSFGMDFTQNCTFSRARYYCLQTATCLKTTLENTHKVPCHVISHNLRERQGNQFADVHKFQAVTICH